MRAEAAGSATSGEYRPGPGPRYATFKKTSRGLFERGVLVLTVVILFINSLSGRSFHGLVYRGEFKPRDLGPA